MGKYSAEREIVETYIDDPFQLGKRAFRTPTSFQFDLIGERMKSHITSRTSKCSSICLRVILYAPLFYT